MWRGGAQGVAKNVTWRTAWRTAWRWPSDDAMFPSAGLVYLGYSLVFLMDLSFIPGMVSVFHLPPPLSEEEAKVLSQQHEWIRTVLDREVLGGVVQWVIMELYHMCQAGTSYDCNET